MERYFDVTIYEAGCTDFDNEGICGPLFPTACYHDEEANAGSEITLEHPRDDQGKWREIRAGRILKCWIQTHLTPEISERKIVTSVEKWTVKAGATSGQRALYNKLSGGKKLRTLPAGLSVTVVEKPDGDRYKIKSASHGTGYVDPEALEYETSVILPETSAGIETAEPGSCIAWQLFEIEEPTFTDDGGVVATAHHITYQLLTNMTGWRTMQSASIGAALDGIMDNCEDPHDFHAYTDMADERTGFGWSRQNPIKCMLDPETGVTALFPCELIRDNWDMFFLSSAGRNRGVRIEAGRNLEGIKYKESINGLYTHIMPVGHEESGEDLLLPEKFVVSPLAEQYPRKFIYVLECSDCEVGKNDVTKDIALTRMREQAQAVLDGGCDLPVKSVEITVSNLSGADGTMIADAVEPLLIYDYATVLYPEFGIDLVMKVVKRRWDCLRGRLVSIVLGTVGDTLGTSSLASWQIPNGISGNKLLSSSVGSGALAERAISAKHLQVGSVNAQAIQSESIAAKHIAAGALDAITIEAVAAHVEQLTAKDIETDRLAAAFAAFTVMTAGTAEFDRATVAHLVAQAMNLEFGTAGQVFIKNLAVEYAQMVGATIASLCIKASDGNYYELDVNADGGVSAVPVTVTDDEKSAGETSGGRVILETNITAANLSAGNLLSTYALINRIDAARIDVDEFFARDATIALLRTSKIVGEKSIEIIAGEAADAKAASEKAIAGVTVQYAQSSSTTQAPADGWSTAMPAYEKGKHIWQRTVTLKNNGTSETSEAVCISGADGEDAAVLRIDSSRGTVFKNNMVSTVLSAVIYRGGERITDAAAMRLAFGPGAYLQWHWQRMDDERFGVILSSDSRLQNEGFQFVLTPEDVDSKVTFMCELHV